MKEYLIINAVPTYDEAPVSLEVLKNYTSQIVNAIEENKAAKKYIIADKCNREIMSLLKESLKKVLDSKIEIIEADSADRFVYSNATAALKVIEGEKPIPTGIDGKYPVFSLEDLLRSDKKIVFIDGNAKKKGAFTFLKTIKVRDIISQCGSVEEFKGIYFGYPMGVLLGKEHLDDEIELKTDYIRIFDNSDCILNQLVSISERYSKESCGRCVFGYEGVTQINMIISDIAQKKGKPDDIELLIDLCSQMKKQTLCDIGISAANTVMTAIENFRDEIEEHITKKNCRASVCKKFVTYHILPDLCNGCTDCLDECEDEAIIGKKKFVHVIDQDECTQCGKCINVCEKGAIVRAGAIKPVCPKKPIPCK